MMTIAIKEPGIFFVSLGLNVMIRILNDTDNECPRVNRIERPEICDPFRDEIGGDFIHSQSK